MTKLQVEPEHYDWKSYNAKGRWVSYWHQVDEVLAVHPQTCLEIGVGTGLVRSVLQSYGVEVTCVDIDERLGVDRVGDVRQLPSKDREFDVVLCAQVLEHLPWSDLPRALSEIARATEKRAIISLPQSGRPLEMHFRLPLLGHVQMATRLPARKPYTFDGQHWWQVGAKGSRQRDVREQIQAFFQIDAEYTVPEFSYHRFYTLSPLRANKQ